MQVVLGGVDIEKEETYDQAIRVERAIVHEQYRESPVALHNDIGEAERDPAVQERSPSFEVYSRIRRGGVRNVLLFGSPSRSLAPARSHDGAVLRQGDPLRQDGLPAQPGLQQRDRVRHLGVGRD